MKILVIAVAVLMAVGVGWAGYSGDEEAVVEEKPKPPAQFFCPVSKMSDNDKCLNCHKLVYDSEGNVKFGLEEIAPDANFSDKPYCLEIEIENGRPFGYMTVTNIDSNEFRSVYLYYKRHPELEKLVVEIYSGGGSVMAAWLPIYLRMKRTLFHCLIRFPTLMALKLPVVLAQYMRELRRSVFPEMTLY